MTLPPKTVMLRVDYGDPSWRDPAPCEDANAREFAGYAELTHDGDHMWIKFDNQHEIEMTTEGARIISAAIVAFADMLEGKA
jgi:hypothetical protein